MIDFLSYIVSVLSLFLDFFFFIIESLLSLILLIPKYLSLLFESINILPSFLIPFIIAFISINLIQYLINRRA